MVSKSPPRQSYLLRMWQTGGPGGAWQASVEDPETGKRTGFASLEQLFTYLMDLSERQDAGQEPGTEDERPCCGCFHPTPEPKL